MKVHRDRRCRALCVGLALLLSGCAQPDYLPYQPPPFGQEMAWGGAAPHAALGQPVSEAPAPHSGLNLADVVRACLETDPKIWAAGEGVNQARADLWTASLLPNPGLSSGITALPLVRPFTVDRQGGPPQLDNIIYLPISWLLSGKRTADMGNARLGIDVAGAEFADQVRQRVSAAVTAYYDLLEAEALLKLARADLENLERVEQVARARAKGVAGAADVQAVLLAMRESARELRRRQTAVVTTRATLRALLGRLDGGASLRVAGALDVLNPILPPPPEEAFHLAEEYRPDLLALRLKVARADAEILSQKARGFPEVTPWVGYTRQFQRKAIGFPDADSYDLGVDMKLPLFDRNQGGIARAQSLRAQAGRNYEAQLVQLRAEVEQAVEELRAAHEALTREPPDLVQNARTAVEHALAAYKAGERPLDEVLDAVRNHRDAARQPVLDRAAYWRALHRLNATLGKQILP
ncbi:MAG: TolC family protein [Gemmataceae bacterium]|nr:TolC family protein [Gemmataceae bacterium]